MNIHEYQAKALLKKFGAPVSDGAPILSSDDIESAVSSLPGPVYVVKSQIHAGGRGKGTFKELGADAKGGVRVCFSPEDAIANAQEMFGKTLVTQQTGPAGKQVNRLYIEDGADIDQELYLSILVDRENSKVSFVASTEGGMDIETVAHETPEKIHTIAIDPLAGISADDVAKLNAAFELSGDAAKDGETLFPLLYNAFVETDMSLDGDIGCMVNGAGLAMATMDIIKLYGASPANFLDVGGGATTEKVTAAFKIITSDPNVKGILVNIFGGIMRCDVIAEGVVTAVKEVGLEVPLVVRLEGTKVQEGKDIINSSGLNVIAADDLDDAAQKVVKAVKG